MLRTLLTAMLLIAAPALATASEREACLNTGPDAIPPFEAAKRALIDGEVESFFEAYDPAMLFREELRADTIGNITGAVAGRPVLWCTLLQRVAYSDSYVGEVFVLRYEPQLFVYFAFYAMRQDQGWVPNSFAYNSDFAVIREHLR